MIETPRAEGTVRAPASEGSPGGLVRRHFGHLPALDGLRGVAVIAVLLFHGGMPWASGGFLGVDIFFVLSGFLITSLLLEERSGSGTIALSAFWIRRARRLLPALFLLVAGAALFTWTVSSPEAYARIRGDVFATLAYFANWHFIASQASYFARTGDPSPLAHTWSLAIEEQFYVVWPLLLLLVCRGRRPLLRTGVVAAAGLVASAAAMAVVFHPGADPSRAYYGTDTRAHVIMMGALLAVVVARLRRTGGFRSERANRVLGDGAAFLAVPAAAVVVIAVRAAQGTDAWVYRGGLVGVSAAVAVIIAAINLRPRSVVPFLLSWSPLRFAGRISYGVYLYHWPLFLVLNHARTGLYGAQLLAVRVGATAAVATVSFYAVEQPIRRGALRRWRAATALPAAIGATVAATVAATTVPAATAADVVAATPARSTAVTSGTTPSGLRTSRPPLAPGQPLKVMFVGDSVAETLGVGLVSPARQYGIRLDDQGTLGCGVVRGGPYRYFGAIDQELAQCETWPSHFQYLVSTHDPDVVFLVAGRWEVMDRVHNGVWTNIEDPAFASYVQSELQRAVTILSSRGAIVALATAPYYLRGERPDGGRWPEDDPARVDAFNRVVRAVAAANPTKVALIDLGGHTAIGDKYTPYIDGIEMRYDGVHFTPAADRWLAPWLLPQLAALGPAVSASATSTTTTYPSSSYAYYHSTTTTYRSTYHYYSTTTTTYRSSYRTTTTTVRSTSTTYATTSTTAYRSTTTTLYRPTSTTTATTVG
ncbi:MAG TPA: acyltransferase family protein [Acidimicrobiales bacterium]|nr:acyltransferase family protein [Acidimicrobiales bacterium]